MGAIYDNMTRLTNPQNLIINPSMPDLNTPASTPALTIQGDIWDGKSYTGIRTLRDAWRLAGGDNDIYSEEFNLFDNPGQYYFRIFFDFTTPGGLLYTGNDDLSKIKGDAWTSRDTIPYADNALNYLMVNGEWERAEMLKTFIILLSNIASRSPWYFISIDGLGELIKVDGWGDPTQFKIPDSKQISIKCLPDSYDTRIGTLLDLYKAITFSHRLDKVILPENLRLFNMYIYIFHTSIGSGSVPAMKDASFDQKQLGNYPYVTSSKLIELHGCELDPNANATGYGSINNEEGFTQEYTMVIQPKKVYEQRYNEFVMRKIGDMVLSDLFLDEKTYSAWGQKTTTAQSGNTIKEDIEVKSPEDIYELHKNNLGVPQNPNLLDGFKGSNKNISPEDTLNIGDNMRVDKGFLGTKIGSVKGSNKNISPEDTLNIGDNMRVDKGFLGTKIGSVVSKFAGSVKSVADSALATLSSYSPSNLLNTAINAAGTALQKLTFGNMFHSTINDIASNVSSTISQYSADALVSKTVNRGWKKVERTEPNGRGLGGNLYAPIPSTKPKQIQTSGRGLGGNLYTPQEPSKEKPVQTSGPGLGGSLNPNK